MSEEIKKEYDNPWIFNGKPFYSSDIPKDAMGFVYVITETSTGKQYVGKKLFVSNKTVQVKGVKKKVKCESDWKKYWSSSEYIKDELSEGSEFTREIIAIVASKGMSNYIEARLQFDLRVLENGDRFLNGIINLRCNKSHYNKNKLIIWNPEILKI